MSELITILGNEFNIAFTTDYSVVRGGSDFQNTVSPADSCAPADVFIYRCRQMTLCPNYQLTSKKK